MNIALNRVYGNYLVRLGALLVPFGALGSMMSICEFFGGQGVLLKGSRSRAEGEKMAGEDWTGRSTLDAGLRR